MVQARPQLLHELRLYTGAALVGAVLSGLAFGWTGHRDLLQILGAATGALIYAVVTHRRA
jgi:hypothetical protein